MISEIISKAEKGYPIGSREVHELMSIKDKGQLEDLYAAARRVRNRVFGKKIYTYGFVYFSTHCKNNCTFCYYRRSNTGIDRYRKSVEEIVELSGNLQDAGINLSDLTMGEDPEMYANGYEKLLDIIHAVKHDVGISVMASPGALPSDMFPAVSRSPARWPAPCSALCAAPAPPPPLS